jgi:phage FluMu gp28-like protein
MMSLFEFSNNFHYGYNPIEGKYETFDLDPFQRNFFGLVDENRQLIVKKPRQVFVTSMLATYVAWSLLNINNNDDGKTIVYISNQVGLSKKFVGTVRECLINFCNSSNIQLRDITISDSRVKLQLTNGNRLMIGSSNPDSLRGYRIDELIIDECAHTLHLDKLLEVVLSNVAATNDSKIILASTPNGMETFHDIYSDSIVGKNDFRTFNIKWDDVSSRDEEWLNNMERIFNNDTWKIRQEIYGEFIQYPEFKREPKSKVVQVRVNLETYDKLSKRLMELDLSQSEYLRKLIEEDLG